MTLCGILIMIATFTGKIKMENKHWIKLDKDSTGSLKRFHKLIRLFVYYHYKSKFSFRNKTKSRYYTAKTGIESLMKKHIRKNYIGYSKWEAELLGSRSIPDMKCNINQKYLITLSSSEYTKNKFRVIPFDSNFEYYVVQILTESGWENVTSAFVATDRLDLNCRNQPLLIKSFELACDKANWLAIDNNYLTYIEEQDKIYNDKVNELSSRNREYYT